MKWGINSTNNTQEFTPSSACFQIGTLPHDTPDTPPTFLYLPNLVKESNDLSGNVLASGLLVVHDTSRGGENNVTELTGWEQLDNPLLEFTETDVESWGDDTGLVETIEIVSGSAVVDVEFMLTGRSIE